MNTEISEIETEAPDSVPEQAEMEPRRKGGFLAFFAFLLALAALGSTGWLWWQDRVASGQEQQEFLSEISRLDSSGKALSLKMEEMRKELDSLEGADTGAEVAALKERVETDHQQITGFEKSSREQLALSRSLQAAMDSIQSRLVAAEAALSGVASRELDASGELDLSEIDYLLRLANERLKLFSDPSAADQALEVADMQLAALDNPIYLGVRQDIAKARRELSLVKMPDYLEIGASIDSLQEKIASLPFRGEEPVPRTGQAPVEEGWWQKVKSVFSGMVTIRRSTEQENQRISLDEKDYIRQRVWLQLEVAHLALMRREQQQFTDALDRVQETLVHWFDPGFPGFRDMTQDLENLKSTIVQPEFPDITAAWATLRLLRDAGQAQPPAPIPVGEDQ